MKIKLSHWIAREYESIDRKTVIRRFNNGEIQGFRLVREGKLYYVEPISRAADIFAERGW